MSGILEGIRVVEVASMAAAPSTTVILADLGAEVIKVEPPSGDLWRYGHKVVPMPPSDVAYTTFIQNRSKKSVALNLADPAAQEALHRLAATADVFLTNSPRQVQEKLKHTYEDIKAINPRVIYAWVNGFGSLGPDKDAPGYDMTALYARSGLMEEMRPKNGDPAVLPASAGDVVTSTALFGAVMTGLFHRERTGEGSKVSTSLMNNGLWMNSSMLQAALAGAPPIKKFHRTEWPNPVTAGTYKTKDNRFIIIVELNPANFENCIDALGAEHLKGDARFTTPELRYKHHQVLFDEIQKIIGSHELSAISDILSKGRVNFSVAQTSEECIRDEHMIANGCFPEVEGSGGIRTVDSPIQIQSKGVDKVNPKKPPGIGEHTLSELIALGYSEEDVRSMAEARAVGLPRQVTSA